MNVWIAKNQYCTKPKGVILLLIYSSSSLVYPKSWISELSSETLPMYENVNFVRSYHKNMLWLYNFFVKMWMNVGTQYSVSYILRIFHADCRGTICIDDTIYVHSQKGFLMHQVTSKHFIPVINIQNWIKEGTY